MTVTTTQFVRVIENALSAELCNELISIFDASPNTQPGRTGSGVDISKKRSRDVSIQRNQEFSTVSNEVLKVTSDKLIEYLSDFYFALIGPMGLTMKHPVTGQATSLTAENFEEIGAPQIANLVKYMFRLGDINAQKYDVGEGGYPYWHSEIYPQQNSTEALHRNLLFMFYLNDVDEGGETEFFYQDLKIKPQAGTMVIAPAGFTHTHRGNVPISNDKYILTSWVLFNPASILFGINK